MNHLNQYEDTTDEELLCRLRDGESAIMDFLMEKYKYLVKNKARTMFILGADTEDLGEEPPTESQIEVFAKAYQRQH